MLAATDGEKSGGALVVAEGDCASMVPVREPGVPPLTEGVDVD